MNYIPLTIAVSLIIIFLIIMYNLFTQYNQSRHFIKKIKIYIKEQEAQGVYLNRTSSGQGLQYEYGVYIGSFLFNYVKEYHVFYVKFENEALTFKGKNVFLYNFFKSLKSKIHYASIKKEKEEKNSINLKFKESFIK
jgi:hypothetical protein